MATVNMNRQSFVIPTPNRRNVRMFVPTPRDLAFARSLYNPNSGFSLEEILLASCIEAIDEHHFDRSTQPEDLYRPLDALSLIDMNSLLHVLKTQFLNPTEGQLQMMYSSIRALDTNPQEPKPEVNSPSPESNNNTPPVYVSAS